MYGITGLKPSGAFAEAVITSESHLAVMPAGLSFEQAACLAAPAVMAWSGLIDRAGLQRGQRVFVNGCTGGVGEAVVQLARLRGATIAGHCSLASLPRARELGVDPVYDYAATSPADLPDLRGAFDVVFDTNGTLAVRAAMRMLTKTGVFLDINASPAKFLHAALARRHKIFFCKPATQILTAVARAAADGGIRMTVGETVPVEAATGLITELEKGRKIGGKGLILLDQVG